MDRIAFHCPVVASGCSRNLGLCQARIVSTPAIPGQINLRPPENPAMKWLDQSHSDLHFRFHVIVLSTSEFHVATYLEKRVAVYPVHHD